MHRLPSSLPAPARSAEPVSLAISFPEGFTVRLMTDRVAEVRRIAIRKRHVTPVLTGAGYAAAAKRAAPPAGFGKPASFQGQRVEGFLFPSLYRFGPATTAPQLIASQLAAFRQAFGGHSTCARPARGRTRPSTAC